MDIAEQLKRIADALEAQNALHREIFEFDKQMRVEGIAQQEVEHELSQKSSLSEMRDRALLALHG